MYRCRIVKNNGKRFVGREYKILQQKAVRLISSQVSTNLKGCVAVWFPCARYYLLTHSTSAVQSSHTWLI